MIKVYFTLTLLFVSVQFTIAQWVQSGSTLSTTNSVDIGPAANPGYKLYVNTGNTFPFGIAGNDSTFTGADIAMSRVNSSFGLGHAPSIQFADIKTGHATMMQGSQGQLLFFNYFTSWVERMRINASGNLLIGETTQVNTSYKLDVGGGVRANQVTVNTSGADFVFAPSYKLYPLAGLKDYIYKNHHLPGIEPAKQMQAEGLNLGENQTKLLQKVEELTLYLIQKDEELKKLKADIAIQKADNEALDARLKKIEEFQNSVRIQKN